MTKKVSKLFFLFTLILLTSFNILQAQNQNSGKPHSAISSSDVREMPAQFVAHRIYVQPVTVNEDTLRFYTDTGGGSRFIYESVVDRLGLAIDTLHLGDRAISYVALPSFQSNAWIPLERRLFVFPGNKVPNYMKGTVGLLGQNWFGGRIWTFNYIEEKLLLHDSTEGLSFKPAHTVHLEFKTDSTGQRVNNFPSVEATIAGETYAFLFDTGATITLSDSAYAVIDDGLPQMRGGSFIVHSLFEKWHNAHPGWRVIMNGSTLPGADLIKVPEVTIAGHTVGPVWFATRPDKNFHGMMSSYMDRQVEGALGGSLFQYFVITVDYPGARAYFRRPE